MVNDATRPSSERNERVWASLREKGHKVTIYVADQLRVVVDGVEMPFDDAAALDRGLVTLDEIARHYSDDKAK